MHLSPTRAATLAATGLAAIVAVSFAACDPTPTTPPAAEEFAGHAPELHGGRPDGDVQRQIDQLRIRTAKFHRFDAARDAGWTEQITPCFSDPVGGMGFHYGNPALIDGTVEALEPELLLYEPQKNGRLRFVAVEYIVPFTAWTSAEPPKLYGRSFMRNEAFGIWALHVWHVEDNPRGVFADWNPNVSCQYAP